MSEIERIKALNQISSYIGENTQNELIRELNLNDCNLEKRIKGLKIEDEFALIIYFLQICKHIVSIDEATSVLTPNSNQADFLLHLKSGEKLLIEVKSKPAENFSISLNNLEKRISFAKDLDFELFFALNLNRTWCLYSAQFIQENGGKINIKKNIEKSIFFNKFNVQAFLIPKGIKVISLYSKKATEYIEIKDPKYGYLLEYTFIYDGKIIFKVDYKNMENLIFSLCLEHFGVNP